MIWLVLLAGCTTYSVPPDRWIDIDHGSLDAAEADFFASSVMNRLLLWNGASCAVMPSLPQTCAGVAMTTSEGEVALVNVLGSSGGAVQMAVWK